MEDLKLLEKVILKDSLIMNILEVNSSIIIIELYGYIDSSNYLDFQRTVNDYIRKEYIYIIFNCTELNYVSSSGIAAFTAFNKNLSNEKNGKIVLANVQKRVLEILTLIKMNNILKIASDIDDALNYLNQS